MHTQEAWPEDSWLETSFTLFDPDRPHREGDGLWDTYIAGVHQIPHGPEGGMWTWSVTISLPGPRCPYATSGREPTRKEAARKAVEVYQKILKFYEANPWQPALPEKFP